MDNVSHDKHPRSSLTDGNIRAVHDLIEGKQRLTVDEINAEVDIRYYRTQGIITDHLGFREVCVDLIIQCIFTKTIFITVCSIKLIHKLNLLYLGISGTL